MKTKPIEKLEKNPGKYRNAQVETSTTSQKRLHVKETLPLIFLVLRMRKQSDNTVVASRAVEVKEEF